MYLYSVASNNNHNNSAAVCLINKWSSYLTRSYIQQQFTTRAAIGSTELEKQPFQPGSQMNDIAFDE